MWNIYLIKGVSRAGFSVRREVRLFNREGMLGNMRVIVWKLNRRRSEKWKERNCESMKKGCVEHLRL